MNVSHQIPSPFPWLSPSGLGERIVNEMCYCNHLRSDHEDRFDYGHGPWAYPTCNCPQYTWRNFIYGEKL